MASLQARGSFDDQEVHLTVFINQFSYERLWPVYDQEAHLTAVIGFTYERLWPVYDQEVHLTIKRLI